MVVRSVCLLVTILAVQQSFAQSTDAILFVEPQTVQVDLFYNGAQIRVSGISQPGRDLALVCTGQESKVELNEKEKIWGFLWINARTVVFQNVPSLYQVVSSPHDSLASGMFFDGIGFRALENRIVPKADDGKRRCFPELVKLKEHEGLYSVQEGSLEVQPGGAGRQKFSTLFRFPSSVAPGEYKLRLMGLAEGRPVTLDEQVITVRLAGMAAVMRSLSSDYGLMYGILSVVIALAAGLLSGIVFGRRSGKGGH